MLDYDGGQTFSNSDGEVGASDGEISYDELQYFLSLVGINITADQADSMVHMASVVAHSDIHDPSDGKIPHHLEDVKCVRFHSSANKLLGFVFESKKIWPPPRC